MKSVRTILLASGVCFACLACGCGKSPEPVPVVEQTPTAVPPEVAVKPNVASPAEPAPSEEQHSAIGTGEPNRDAAEWVLRSGGRLQVLVDGQRREVQATADLPAAGTAEPTFKIVRIDFSVNEKPVNERELDILAGLSELTDLRLDNIGVTDSVFDHLKSSTRLRDLSLLNTKVADSGLAKLKDFNLLTLQISGTQVTDAGIMYLNGLPELDGLYMNRTAVTDNGLKSIASLSRLGGLGLGGTQVTDAGLVHLKSLTGLRDLRLNNTAVTNTGLEHLQGLVNLSNLVLDNTQVSDAGVARIKDLPKLTGLGLAGTQVSDAGLVHLKGMTKLTSLALEGSKVSDVGITDLKVALPKCGIGGRWYNY